MSDKKTVYIVRGSGYFATVVLGVFDSRKEMYAFIKSITGGSRKIRKELDIVKAEINNPDSGIQYM